MTECPQCHGTNLLFLVENRLVQSEEECLDCHSKVVVPLDLEPAPCPSHDRIGCSMCFAADLLGPEDTIPYGVSPDYWG